MIIKNEQVHAHSLMIDKASDILKHRGVTALMGAVDAGVVTESAAWDAILNDATRQERRMQIFGRVALVVMMAAILWGMLR